MIGVKLILLSSLVFMGVGSCSPSYSSSSSTIHTHQYGPYQHDEHGHWRVCLDESCGYLEEKAAHQFVRADQDYQVTFICSICGYSYSMGEMLKYEYLPEEDGYAVSKGIYFDTQIEELTIPSTHAGKPVIEVGSFGGLEQLKKVTIPEGVLRLGDACFQRCPKLEALEIPDSVESIGAYFCEGDTALASLKLSSQLWRIPELAFNGTAISSVTLGKEVREIERHAFSFCPNLTTIEVSSENPYYTTQDGVLFSKDMTELAVYPTGREGAYEIPDTVTSLGITAFEGAMALTSVKLSAIPSLAERSFFRCENLTSVTIPEGVVNIGTDAFYGCYSLPSVVFPSTLESIGNWAFMHCTSLTSIRLPKACVSLGLYPFNDMTALTKFEVASGNPVFEASQGVLYGHQDGHHALLMAPRSFQGLLRIPAGIEYIDNFSLTNTPGLTGMIVPTGFKAFYDSLQGCDRFSAVYYEGTAKDWANIEYSEGTGLPLNISVVYYYSKTKPTNVPDSSLYWRYVDGLPTNWN
ncbi:MAG: leucine-rich repeat domain-containing protein [Bacilli bacterium]|nr:leucine-rich repeat domain-containing protein [Bacilli bacterium]